MALSHQVLPKSKFTHLSQSLSSQLNPVSIITEWHAVFPWIPSVKYPKALLYLGDTCSPQGSPWFLNAHTHIPPTPPCCADQQMGRLLDLSFNWVYTSSFNIKCSTFAAVQSQCKDKHVFLSIFLSYIQIIHNLCM